MAKLGSEISAFSRKILSGQGTEKNMLACLALVAKKYPV